MRTSILLLLAGCALHDTEVRDSVPRGPGDRLVAHEWGTFTAVAGPDGEAVTWRPLLGPSDLPEFVYDVEDAQGVRAAMQTKGSPALVRMETPVIYFYTPRQQTMSARVDFPEGQITEWYPKVSQMTERGGVDWGTFLIDGEMPGVVLPEDGSDSHYYPARQVPQAAAVRVCDGTGHQFERFLFYRGVADFDLSLSVVQDGRDLVLGTGGSPVNAWVFEKVGDRVGWSAVADVGASTRIARPTLDASLPDVLTELRQALEAEGLYRDEAVAMVATWEDHWFEDGLRVFYTLPRDEVDARLPLTLDPVPDEVVRVIMGRVEVLTPEMQDEARAIFAAVDAGQRTRAEGMMHLETRHGRFVEPLLSLAGIED